MCVSNGSDIDSYTSTTKNLDIWNEVIEKANKDFHKNKKEFWAFMGRTSKGNRKGIVHL